MRPTPPAGDQASRVWTVEQLRRRSGLAGIAEADARFHDNPHAKQALAELRQLTSESASNTVRSAGDIATDRSALLALGQEICDAVDVDFFPLPLGHESGVEGVGAIVFLGTSPLSGERRVVQGVLLLGDVISSRALRSVPLAVYENSANLIWDTEGEDTRHLPTLIRDGMESDEFSQLVARHYRAWAAKVPKPAAAMARSNGVKLATMHSWIREARLRKHLAPARARRPKDAE